MRDAGTSRIAFIGNHIAQREFWWHTAGRGNSQTQGPVATIASLRQREEIPFRMKRGIRHEPFGNAFAILQIIERYDQLSVAIGRHVAEMQGKARYGIA